MPCAALAARRRANSNRTTFTGDRPVMAATRTFSIIKPDATRRNLTGAVTKMLEEAGLRVVASKRIQHDPRAGRGLLRRPQASGRSSTIWCTFMISARSWFRCSRARTPCSATATSWARPTRPTPAGHDPQGTGRVDRGQLGPRFGQRRECEDRDRLLLQAGRNRRLTAERWRGGAIGRRTGRRPPT